jgi:ATP/ADP translocase
MPCVCAVQSLKDSIMVTAGGAETLPFLASFGVLPASVAFFVIYGKMVSGTFLTGIHGAG